MFGQNYLNCSILILIWKIIFLNCTQPIPDLIFDLMDETSPNTFIGNLVQKLAKTSLTNQNLSFFLMSSKFQSLTEFFHLEPNGDLTTKRLIDHDNPEEICGPLDCCHLAICQIKINVIMTKPVNQSSLNLNDFSQNLLMFIQIHDENDNAPIFLTLENYSNQPELFPKITNKPFVIYMREEDTLSVYNLPLAKDADSNLNGIGKYELIEQMNDNSNQTKPRLDLIYNIDQNKLFDYSTKLGNKNPKLKQSRPLDYENPQDRKIQATLIVRDKGIPSHQASISIHVYLLDVNDNKPEFLNLNYKSNPIVIPENTTLDYRPIFVLNATDRDSGENARLSYSFSPLATKLVQNKFTINSQTGAISIKKPLDYEIYLERQLTLPVVVKDAGNPPKLTSSSIYVRVLDVNDHIPTLIVQENISIPEGQVYTKPVIRFYIKDEDEISHGNVSFTHHSI